MPEPKHGYDNCAYCGIRFPKTRIGKKHCSTICQQRARNEVRRSKSSEPTCAHCGKTFPDYTRQRSYCSPACKKEAKNKRNQIYTPHWANCEWCSGWYVKKGEMYKFCSPQCQKASTNASDEEEIRQHRRELNAAKRECKDCGKLTSNYRCQACWDALLYGEQDSFEVIDWGVECKF